MSGNDFGHALAIAILAIPSNRWWMQIGNVIFAALIAYEWAEARAMTPRSHEGSITEDYWTRPPAPVTQAAQPGPESAFAEFDKAVDYLRKNGYSDWDGTANGQEITLTGCANMMRQYLRDATLASQGTPAGQAGAKPPHDESLSPHNQFSSQWCRACYEEGNRPGAKPGELLDRRLMRS